MKNSRKKTYGVYGLMEWYCSIPCGGARVDIPFTGGTMTGHGTVPAQYTTEDPFVQVVIEHSDYFRRGRIVLIADIEGSGRFKVADPDDQPAPEVEKPEEDKNPKGDETDEHPVEETEQKPAEVEGDQEADGGDKVTRLEIPSLDDAKAYLIEHFGYKSSNIRSKTAIIAAGAENGIEFVFPN